MIVRPRQRSSVSVLAIATLLAACAESTSVPPAAPPVAAISAVRFDPRLELLDPGAPGVIVICSAGGPASFSVTATPNRGTLAGGGSFSVNTNECVTAWTAVPEDLTEVTIAVTQTAGDFSSIEATAAPAQGLPRMVVDQANQRVVWATNADHGGSATFFQAAPPPPPESKKLVVCKDGPAGTYTFTVSSDAPSGDVFPNGQEFTLNAGECKDAWEQDGPPVDPYVTVTELGDAPLDSIRKELQDSATVIITDSRSVVSRVGFYHGGVVTFFNAICKDENALNFGGAPPCVYPPPAVNCVSITAVEGVAITPVTLTASGGAGGPYTFAATGLPNGIQMSSDGTISGTSSVSGTFSYTVTVTDKDGNTGTSTCTIVVNPPPPPTQFCSFTQGGWGAPPSGDNVGARLYANFAAVYPAGVTIGVSGESGFYSAKFTTASAITTFLPAGGPPKTLTTNYTDPKNTSAGVFAGQVLALQLNIDFSNAGATTPGLALRTVNSGPLAGLTAGEVLALANQVLGGKTSALAPYGITVSQLSDIVTSLNESYTDCTTGSEILR